MNIIDKLKELGVEVTSEIEKGLGGDYISKAEHEKKLGKVEAERDQLKKDYDAAKTTLEGFEGKDFDKLTAEIAEWKKKAEDSEKEYKAALQKRDYSDALKEAGKDLKFTSTSAQKAFFAELESNPLQMRDGKILGFDDFVKSYKETDEGAFVKEESGTRSQFTTTITRQSDGNNGTDLARIRSAMGLKNDTK